MYNQRMAELYHYGVGHKDGGHSGRYPWGSGKKKEKTKKYQRAIDAAQKDIDSFKNVSNKDVADAVSGLKEHKSRLEEKQRNYYIQKDQEEKYKNRFIDARTMSDEELDEALKRLQKETQYMNYLEQIDQKTKSEGKQLLNKSMNSVGTTLLTGIPTGVARVGSYIIVKMLLGDKSAQQFIQKI
jgi:vacuolar-type H+-ATPase subunit H